MPLCLGLRPEPWVAAGLLGCWVLVERSIATRRLLPLVGGLLLAGATTALTPGGLIAFVPFLTPPVWKVLRARTDLHRWPLVAALVAGPASAVLLMVYDQSLGAMLESTRVRSLIGGGAPWYEEAERYYYLLAEGFQGSIGRRAAVLVTLLAAAAVLMAVRRGPKHRMVVTFLLALAVMTFTPTKWTQHFGDLAGVGAAVLVLGAALARRTVGALAAAVAVGALVVAGLNTWPFVSAWFAPSFSTMPPQVVGIPVATLLLVAGAAAVVVGMVWRRVTPPVPLLAVVLVVALALQVLGLVRVAVAHRDSYTPASDAVATLRGDPCGLQRTLSVETDPAAGLLGTAAGVPVDIDGTTLPGFVVDRPVTTDWFPLRGDLVVVTTVGTLRPGDDVRLDFGRETRAITETGDTRVIAPAGATAVRLVIDAGAGGTARVTLPRAPRLTPMEQVLPPGTRAILDWPVAFLFPCLVPEPLPPGVPTVAGRAPHVRPGGGHHLRARVRRPVRGSAAVGHAAAAADLPRGRPDPRRRPALPLDPDHAADHAAAGRHRAHGDGLDLRRARPRAGPRPRGMRMGAMLGLSDTATQTSDLDLPAGRIVAQRGLFAGPSLLVPEDLYARIERGAARRERHRVVARPGQRRQHQHLLRPLPRHLLAAVDSGAGRRGGARRVRHRAGAADGVGHEQGVAHRRRRAGRAAARPCGWSGRSTGSSTAAACGWSSPPRPASSTVSDVRWRCHARAGSPRPPTSSSAPTTASTTA